MQTEQARRLIAQIEALLAHSLGALPLTGIAWLERQPGTPEPHSALYRGVRTALLYALLICGGIVLVSGGRPAGHLFWLSAWGAVYLGWAVFCSHRATERVVALLRGSIVPVLSPGTIDGISEALDARFPRGRITAVSWCVAVPGLAVAAFALWEDMDMAGQPLSDIGVQMLLWGAGWLVVFLTAARCTYVAQFYGVFAEKLAGERDQIYPLDPAASGLVRDVSALGKHVFVFWIGTSLSIASLALFLLPQADGRIGLFVAFPQWSGVSLFVALVMPVSLVFSLVFSTLVFLRSESAIRRAVLQVTRATQATIQREVTGLLALGDRISEVQAARLKLLLERHDAVAKSGSYASFFVPVLSLIPLLTTVGIVAKSIGDIAAAIARA